MNNINQGASNEINIDLIGRDCNTANDRDEYRLS